MGPSIHNKSGYSVQGVALTACGPRRWASQCTREVLATGEAGDVYLVHPLTLHRRASVLRTSFRIISNPNFFANTPLNYLQPRSPVECYGAHGPATDGDPTA